MPLSRGRRETEAEPGGSETSGSPFLRMQLALPLREARAGRALLGQD